MAAESPEGLDATNFCRQHQVYGISLRSRVLLSLPEQSGAGLAQIEIDSESAAFFLDAIGDSPLQTGPFAPCRYAFLQDSSSYVLWPDMGEFLVSADGLRITSRRFEEATPESFEVYLLGQALSFALVRSGFEPLHATSIVVDGRAIAFLGDSGFGKSSLAACFIEAGHRLLTDDLLIVREVSGAFCAYPGPPRIKLFPKMARRFLGEGFEGVPMNSRTRKLIVPLDRHQACHEPAPLIAVYALVRAREAAKEPGLRIAPASSRDAFADLMKNTFNYVMLDTARQQRLFKATSRLAAGMPVGRLFYPRRGDYLPVVRDAILSDIYDRTRVAV